jgi:PAS domain S-box-containing protein
MGDGDAVYGATRESRAHQLALLVESVVDYAIFLLDADGFVASWNSGAERIKGYSAAEIIGQPYGIFFTEGDRAAGRPQMVLGRALSDGRYEDEGWRVRRDGTTFWADAIVTALRDERGTLVGFAKVTRDLTERRAGEEALRAANEQLARKNRELDRFAAVAAHDLQEPLRTIAGFGEILQDRYAGALDERGVGYLDHISAAVGRMQHLVDDLLGYAKAAEDLPAPGVVGIELALGVVLGELAGAIEQRGTDVQLELAPGSAVRSHTRDVEAVLRNLLSNAVKFADPESPRVIVRATPADGSVRVEIIDNGIGVDPADRPRLFRPFQRLNSASDYPGTGLGLAIAQRVVERNGGAIGVESAVGEGSRFWFTLPAPA